MAGAGAKKEQADITYIIITMFRRQDFRERNEKRVSYSLDTVTEFTATGVVISVRGQTLSSVCDFLLVSGC
jgi:hypothetical protein